MGPELHESLYVNALKAIFDCYYSVNTDCKKTASIENIYLRFLQSWFACSIISSHDKLRDWPELKT